MITEKKIKIFKRYDGNLDNWARSCSKKEQSAIDDDDWYVIDSLIQDLSLVSKGITSEGYNNTLNEKLRENCDSKETVSELKKMAEKR